MCILSSQVGVCLKYLPSYSPTGDHYMHDQNVPWQRVINSRGIISPRSAFLLKPQGAWLIGVPRGPGAAAQQAAELRQENIEVSTGSLGEFSVDFGAYGWFPRVLPGSSEDAGGALSSDDVTP